MLSQNSCADNCVSYMKLSMTVSQALDLHARYICCAALFFTPRLSSAICPSSLDFWHSMEFFLLLVVCLLWYFMSRGTPVIRIITRRLQHSMEAAWLSVQPS